MVDCQSFAHEKELNTYAVPEGVTRIPNKTFDQCGNLKAVILPESLKEICDGAFSGCMSLERILIPSAVESIGPQAFTYCMGLKQIEVSEGNRVYSSDQGALYDKLRTTLIKYPAGLTGEAELPEGLCEIGEWAFEWSSISRILVPDGVTHIHARAFSGCIKVCEIVLPESITRIGEQAFFGCRCLKNLVIPEGVMIIERSTFYNCANLESVYIPESVVSLDSWVFDGCPKLVVHCPLGSYTQEYCESCGIRYTVQV